MRCTLILGRREYEHVWHNSSSKKTDQKHQLHQSSSSMDLFSQRGAAKMCLADRIDPDPEIETLFFLLSTYALGRLVSLFFPVRHLHGRVRGVFFCFTSSVWMLYVTCQFFSFLQFLKSQHKITLFRI